MPIDTLNCSRAEPGSCEIYWENQKDIFLIKDDILYLTGEWYYNIEAGSSGFGEYKSYTANNDSMSWSSYPVADLTIKFNPTDGGQNWEIIEAADFFFTDINEIITITSPASDLLNIVRRSVI